MNILSSYIFGIIFCNVCDKYLWRVSLEKNPLNFFSNFVTALHVPLHFFLVSWFDNSCLTLSKVMVSQWWQDSSCLPSESSHHDRHHLSFGLFPFPHVLLLFFNYLAKSILTKWISSSVFYMIMFFLKINLLSNYKFKPYISYNNQPDQYCYQILVRTIYYMSDYWIRSNHLSN